MRHKYGAKPTTRDGIRFASKREAVYYDSLRLRVRSGDVIQFLRQVPFFLPGQVRYVVDFLEFHRDGTVHFVDVKGWNVKKQEFYLTKEFVRNKKMVEDLYAPITIEVVR